MSKRIYISSDYDEYQGDRNVVEEFNRWNESNRHVLEFVDLAKVVSGSVSNNPDCRICDLKAEFNRQINASSAVIFVIGDKTSDRVAGAACPRRQGFDDNVYCTPYKKNSLGQTKCKVKYASAEAPNNDVVVYNEYSYLRHEFEQAKRKNKQIIVVYNSLRKQPEWLPSYMYGYASEAIPFWIKTEAGNRLGRDTQ